MKAFFAKYWAFLLLFALAQSACTPRDRYIRIEGYAQGGTYSVTCNVGGVSVSPEAIRDGIDSLLTLIDTTLSGYNKGSLLSRFNRGERIVPNALFLDTYALAYRWWQETDGALDCAAGPLFDAWGFGFKQGEFPDDARVREILDGCGMKRLPADLRSVLAGDGSVSREECPGSLNYNAIAQGLSCDIVARWLYGIGVKDMLVDIGEIYCDGVNPSRKDWSVGIDRPVDGNETPGAELSAIWHSDGGPRGVVTSGNYRKFYIRDGKKYAHTIDPRAGYPVSHSLLSATITAPDDATADAVATWCLVIGLDQARELILAHEQWEGYLIYDDGGAMAAWNSPGFVPESR